MAILTTVPTSGIGKPGDTAGMVASDTYHLYYTTGDYTGSSVIWYRVTKTTLNPMAVPKPVIVGYSTEGGNAKPRRPIFTGNAIPNSTVEFFVDDVLSGPAILNGDQWAYQPSSDITAGYHTMYAVQTNTGVKSAKSDLLTISLSGPASTLPEINISITKSRNSNNKEDISEKATFTYKIKNATSAQFTSSKGNGSISNFNGGYIIINSKSATQTYSFTIFATNDIGTATKSVSVSLRGRGK